MIAKAEIGNLWARWVKEGKNLSRIFHECGKNMNTMTCLAGPTTPGLFMCLLVMCTMVEMYGKVLG